MNKPLTAARLDPPIEVVMKELVDQYRSVRQRTVRSETTKDKAGALPPAVYYTQPFHPKVMFHDDSTVESRERMEQIMPPVEIVAVGEVPDQEDEYDTDSGSDMMTITTPTPTQQHSPGLVAPFALTCALTCRVCTIRRAHIHYLVNDSVIRS